MPFPYDRYPWLNFQELNLAYFIKHFREIFQEWNTLYHDLLDWKDATDQELEDWKTATMAGLDAWRALTREQLETSISGWETDTLAALDAWKAAFEAEYAALKTEVEGIRDQAAANADAAANSAAAAAQAATAAETAAASLTAALADIAALQSNSLQYMSASEVNDLTIITSMPTSRYFTASGTKVRDIADYRYNSNLPETALLPSSFSSSGQYLVICWRYTAGNAIYEIYRLNGSLHYWAYAGSSLTWIDYSPSATDSALNSINQDITDLRAADASALHLYAGTIPNDPLISLPINTYLNLSGAQLKSYYPTDAFIADLSDSITYLISIYPLQTSFRRVEISARSEMPMLDGNTGASHPATITWLRKIPMTTAEKTYLNRQLRPDVQIYTDLIFSAGWYNDRGEIVNIDANHVHTDPVPVRASTYYYFSATYTIPTGYVAGVFLDENQRPITPVDFTISTYSYDTPNGDPQAEEDLTYVPLYRVRTPVGARFMSYNLDKSDASNLYRLYFASIPVYRHYNTGNLILHSDDSALQYWGKRRLAVIGPSTVMIDRLRRTGNFENNGSSQTQFVVGFQEYLRPYWQSLQSYGFSSASWQERVDEADSDTETHSIYYWLVTKQLYDSELAGFDDYILLSSSNRPTVTQPVVPGTLTSYDDLGDSHTYIGAMRRVIQHIYDLNPQAQIYVQDWRHYKALYSDATGVWADATAMLEALDKLSLYLSIPLIPMFKDSGINHITSPKWTYDNNDPSEVSGSGHWNHIGSRVVGEFFKNFIIG